MHGLTKEANSRDAAEKCLNHAADLLAAAEVTLQIGKANIAFHLALVAVEEIGKARIISLASGRLAREREIDLVRKFASDHVAKIFWAFWSTSFGTRIVDATVIDEHRNMARTLHASRLAGLYVTPDASDPAPSDAITAERARELIQVAQTRLALEKAWHAAPIVSDDDEDLNWFLTTASDEQNFHIIFGQTSQAKLVELRDAQAWVRWLRLEFEQAEIEARSALEQERQRALPEVGVEPKWRMTFTLHTSTHSIRRAALAEWNTWSKLVKLHPSGRRNRALQVEITLFDNVAVDDVMRSMFGLAQRTTLCLNMASVGLFWWYLPEHDHPICDRAVDIASNRPLNIDFYADFRVVADDRQRRVFSGPDVTRLALLFGRLPLRDAAFLDEYWAGVALLGKNDPLLKFNSTCRRHFHRALQLAMEYYGHWRPESQVPFAEAFANWAVSMFGPGDEVDELVRLEAVAWSEDSGAPVIDALNMKACCDFFISGILRGRHGPA